MDTEHANDDTELALATPCIGGYAILCVCLLLYWQERVVHDSQQTLEAKSITASSLRHRLSNLKCTLETELEGVLASVMQTKHTYVYTCLFKCMQTRTYE